MAEYNEGDVVTTPDGLGVVSGVFTEPIDWPVGDEPETVEGTEDNPTYIVGLLSGGSKPYRENELEPDEFDGPEPDSDEIADATREMVEEAGIPDWYRRVGDVESLESMHETMSGLVRVSNVAELARTRGTSEMTYEELIDIPSVDDPEVGFSDWPDSWEESEQPARLILLKAWASMGGTWRACFREMSTNMTPRGARRLCSSMKDEVYGTEMWRSFSD